MNVTWQLWLEQFHFLRPQWLWVLPLLIGVYAIFCRAKAETMSVNRLFNPVLLAFLTQSQATTKHQVRKPRHGAVITCLVLTVLALAGPTVQQIPQPTYQAQIGQVIVMDMSLSMRAGDLKPNRLSQARYKAMDYINANPEANIGLVAYAGDAFVISPITQDGKNLNALIPSLRPELMPVFGSEPQYALEAAFELLQQAGYQQGHIVWLTDGVDYEQIPSLTKLLRNSEFSVSVIAVGTENGAPIQQLNGQMLKDNAGAIVIPRVEYDELAKLARVGRGVFTPLLPNEDDINAIKSTLEAIPDNVSSILETQNDKWYELGPYLLLPVLVVLLWSMRPQWLFVLCMVWLLPQSPRAIAQSQTPNAITNALVPPPSAAQEIRVSDPLSVLPKRLKNRAQQALAAYQNEDFARAQELFDDVQWQANALYQQGLYDQALPLFAQDESAVGRYNTGNALASLQQYEEALAAYDAALALDPSLQVAQDAKEALELFLENMPPQQQSQDGQDQNSDELQDQQNQEQDSQSQESNSEQPSSDQQPEQQQNNQNQADAKQNEASQDESQTESQTQPEPNEDNADDASQNNRESESEQHNETQEQPMTESSEPLTPEQREQQERMQSLLNKVPDDPGYLLKRKMQLEHQQRQRQRLPNTNKKEW